MQTQGVIEIKKFYPDVDVIQEACPMWVPLVENNEYDGHGADYFIKKNIHQLLKKRTADRYHFAGLHTLSRVA